MNHILALLAIVVVAVLGFTIIYKLVPFKVWGNKKPKFCLFPKYVAGYDRPVSDIVFALEKMQFKKTGDMAFARGKVTGDFSAKHIKLAVVIDEANKQVKIFAPAFGILFDTGDIWQLTSDIIHS